MDKNALPVEPDPGLVYAYGLISEFHSGNPPASVAALIPQYLYAQSPRPTVVFHAGDIYLNTGWDSLQACFGRYGMTVYSTLGNHDFDAEGSAAWPYPEYYPNGESPIDLAASLIDGISTVPYYAKTFGPLKALFVDNNVDTTVYVNGVYRQKNPECNPPGRYCEYWQQNGFPYGNPDGTNPEYAGWVTSDTTSGQLQWIKDQCAGWPGFVVVIAHGPPYVPCVWTDQGRPTNRAGRSVGWAIASRAGVDVALTGHTHSVGWTLPMYKGQHVDDATRFLTARCSFTRFAGFGYGPESPSISENDMVWPKEADLDDANEVPSTVFGYLIIDGNTATMRVVQGHADSTFTVRATTTFYRRAK
jgi:predicted phosphodiesterase